MTRRLGVIGGSGVYFVEGLEDSREQVIDTPWGAPSDALTLGRAGDVEVAFLPRHGRGHRHSPSAVPFRANVAALKMAGCTEVVAVSACGSFREEMAPGHVVVVDQFVDRTKGRPRSFFGTGCVAHVPFGHPTCARLSAAAAEAARAAGATVHEGGTYLAMEGPAFSTAAESRMHRAWGCDVVGMTNMPEAVLMREAEMCYAALALVTDYDAWHPDHDAVDVAAVIGTLRGNVDRARATVAALPAMLGPAGPGGDGPCPHGCDRALDHAVMTAPERRDPALVERLRAVAGRVL